MLLCLRELEQNSSSPDWVGTKISGNVGPPNKQRTCAAIAEGHVSLIYMQSGKCHIRLMFGIFQLSEA